MGSCGLDHRWTPRHGGSVELYEVMRTSAAVREFTDDPVPDDVVYGILDNARFAPSGGNRQGWRVILVKDPAIRAAVRDHYVMGFREYSAHLERGLVPFAPGDDGRWTGPAVDLEQARATPRSNDFADLLDRVPVMLVLCVDVTALAVLDNGLNRQSFVGGASVYPFAHNILLAARNEGLGGVVTTMLCRDEPAVKQLLGIPDPYALASLVALGRPVRQVTHLRRLPVEEFTTVDTFDGPAFMVR